MNCRKCGSNSHPYADPDCLCYACWTLVAVAEYQEQWENEGKEITARDE